MAERFKKFKLEEPLLYYVFLLIIGGFVSYKFGYGLGKVLAHITNT